MNKEKLYNKQIIKNLKRIKKNIYIKFVIENDIYNEFLSYYIMEIAEIIKKREKRRFKK